MASHILGISAFYHDAAAALVADGTLVAAAQEERFSRKKHDPRFPKGAINYCLEEAFIEPDEPRVSARKTDRISARRQIGQRAILDRQQMALRYARLGRNFVQLEPGFLACFAQPRADPSGYDSRFLFFCVFVAHAIPE